MTSSASPKSLMRHRSELANRLPLPLRRSAQALLLLVALTAVAWTVAATPASADFRLCNNTNSRIGVALGYKDNDGWATEGWWNLPARNCDTLLRGSLAARFYYIYAVDYDHGGEWSARPSVYPWQRSSPSAALGRSARLRPHRLLRGRHRRAADLTVQPTEAGRRPGPAGQAPPTAPPAGSRSGPRRRRRRMRRKRRTKIVATLGPASSSREMIAALFAPAPTYSAST
jgi:uncharacterized membrane protein